MIAVQGYTGQKVAVLGLGRSGLAAARALAAGGAEVLCWDDDPAARILAEAEGFLAYDLGKGNAWDDVAALIVSPGIASLYPAPHKLVARAMEAGVPVDNDVGLFFRSFATQEWDNFEVTPSVVAVTGSNGKSTTSALIAHVLAEAGRDVQLGGNIGRGVLDLEPATEASVAVLELSSYQIELARALTPDIAVFINLTPDHLERHGGMGGYFAAKRRLLVEGGPDRAVVGVDQPEGVFLANQLGEGIADARVIRISVTRKLTGPGWQIFVRKGHLAEWRKGRQVASIDLRGVKSLPGTHNHQNACAAYAVLRSLGLPPREVASGFRSFKGLPHRSQIVAEAGGVTYVNDSKATNMESAAAALQAFERVRWIAGGEAKAGGIKALAPHLSRVAKAYLIGASAGDFAGQLGDTEHEICQTMEVAVARAHAEAEPGDIVLLAPAAASFDQYVDFEARGEDFCREVMKRIAQDGAD